MSETLALDPVGAAGEAPHRHELRGNGISGAGAIVMAVAGSAPAYSIAATTPLLIGTAGLASVASLLWCGIPMLGIAFAFAYLGRSDVNAGAAYSWVGRALHPSLGFLSGWSLVVSATIFMVSGALPAGQFTLQLINPALTSNTWLVTGVGAVWFLVMLALVVFGVTVTALAQWIMSSIEVGILVIVAVAALIKGFSGSGVHTAFSWSWFGFAHFGSAGTFATAALIAAFYFWGWDVSANLNEETSNGHKASGRGGIVGVFIVFALFLVFTTATQVLLPNHQATGTNAIIDLGHAIFPGWGGTALIIAAMLSTIATLETTLIQASRTLFAMGRDNTIPRVFGTTARRWKTPAFATLIVGVVAVGLFIGSNSLGSVSTIMTDAVDSIGFQITFYYSLAAAAVVVTYRRQLFRSVKTFLLVGLWPAIGALFMAWAFVQSLISDWGDWVVIGIGIGSIVVGLFLVWGFWGRARSYYTKRPLEPENEIVPATNPIDLSMRAELVDADHPEEEELHA
ncbi:APC family permease [Gryllotalpicola reticulitermitis]|uniref:APC family permease n=1 Tax=Gryllotalpicola reticulitermitis TaxID=1184153 RepID=A0ABV8QBJ7_9MICO